jgi:hypothetical protein
MSILKEKPYLKNEIENCLKRIANMLLINASFIDNPGLINGKMGIALFFYKYGRYSGKKVFTDYAGELIDEIYGQINNNTVLDFTNGLMGIGWSIEYLVENKFVDADTDEVLADIDKTVCSNINKGTTLLDSENDLFGPGFYFISRLRRHELNENNLNTLTKREQLIYLADECERLLVHKRYLDFNILQLSVASINSLLWFMLEMGKLDLCSSKVKKILKYLPDYISKGENDINSITAKYVLYELAQIAAEKFSDPDLQQQYKLLSEKIRNEVNNSTDKKELVFESLQSINLQKLIYRPYLDDMLTDMGSFERALVIFDNEENWNQLSIGITKSNLGLTGLAGTGLLLLTAVGS